jgi:hypothetical protein
VVVNIGGTYDFTASGGSPPYDFRIKSGGGAISLVGENVGRFEASSSEGLVFLELIDGEGATKDAKVNVLAPPALKISPSEIWINTNDTFTFSVLGGAPPYTFTVLTGTGTFPVPTSGEYHAPGTAETSSVRVIDSLSVQNDATVNVVSSGGLGINPTSGYVPEGRNFKFNAYGGTPNYIYAIVSGIGSINSGSGLYDPGAGLPGDTAAVRVTDAASDTATASVTIIPATPTGLEADGSYGGPKDIKLKWKDNSAGESGYKIERKDHLTGFTEIVTTRPDVTSYKDSDLVPNTPYTYRVRAFKTGTPTLYSAYSELAFDISNPGEDDD